MPIILQEILHPHGDTIFCSQSQNSDNRYAWPLFTTSLFDGSIQTTDKTSAFLRLHGRAKTTLIIETGRRLLAVSKQLAKLLCIAKVSHLSNWDQVLVLLTEDAPLLTLISGSCVGIVWEYIC